MHALGRPSVHRVRAVFVVAMATDMLLLLLLLLLFCDQVPTDPTLIAIMFRDMCDATLYQSQSDCSTFSNGVLSNGLHAAIVGMLSTSQSAKEDVLTMLSTNANNFNALNASLSASSTIGMLRALQERYLVGANSFTSRMYVTAVEVSLRQVFSQRLLVMLLFLALVLALFYLYLIPLVWELNAEHKRTTTLLLIIPGETMEQMADLRAFVEQLADTSREGSK